MTYDEKAVIEAYKYVSKVVKNEGGDTNSKITIEKVKPDFIVIGSDWAARDYYKQMQFTQDWLDERNILLCYVPYTLGVSTTEVKKRVKERYTNDILKAKNEALNFQKTLNDS